MAWARRRRWLWLGTVAAAALAARTCAGDDAIDVATWNIRFYPESTGQESAAFDLLKELDVEAVALQEITTPRRFAKVARARLGPSWRAVWASPSPELRVGVAFDSDALRLVSKRTYPRGDGARPFFEARLEPRGGGEILRMIVVHLIAGGDHVDERGRELARLRPLVAAAVESGDRVVLLGDFNATSREDRDRIAALAEEVGMKWATEGLGCTSYWEPEGQCQSSALDHVLVTPGYDDVAARGPCETVGCEPEGQCPLQVSDHCPVTLEVD